MMSINIRGIQNELETKLGLLDFLKGQEWNEELELDIEGKNFVVKGTQEISESNWNKEVEFLKLEINDLFDLFEKEVDLLSCDNFNYVDRYTTLMQTLKRDYNNICRYIDSRKKRFKLFNKTNKAVENQYQTINIDVDKDTFERSQLFRERGALQESLSYLNSIFEQAGRTTASLKEQRYAIKSILDKTRSLRKKSINNIQTTINLISNLKIRQNFVVLFVFCCLVLIILYIKVS